MKTHSRKIGVSHGRNIGVIDLLQHHHLVIIGVVVVIIVTTFFGGGNLKFQKGAYYKGTFGAFPMTVQYYASICLTLCPRENIYKILLKNNKILIPFLAHPLPTFKIT